ncbi:hypothetical protein Tco_0176310, partial [Tanacetum coccineum]
FIVSMVPEEFLDVEELRSMAVRCRTRVAERTVRRRSLINHLEHRVGNYPTSGWLRRLGANQREDLHLLGMVNAFVARLY